MRQVFRLSTEKISKLHNHLPRDTRQTVCRARKIFIFTFHARTFFFFTSNIHTAIARTCITFALVITDRDKYWLAQLFRVHAALWPKSHKLWPCFIFYFNFFFFFTVASKPPAESLARLPTLRRRHNTHTCRSRGTEKRNGNKALEKGCGMARPNLTLQEEEEEEETTLRHFSCQAQPVGNSCIRL